MEEEFRRYSERDNCFYTNGDGPRGRGGKVLSLLGRREKEA